MANIYTIVILYDNTGEASILTTLGSCDGDRPTPQELGAQSSCNVGDHVQVSSNWSEEEEAQNHGV